MLHNMWSNWLLVNLYVLLCSELKTSVPRVHFWELPRKKPKRTVCHSNEAWKCTKPFLSSMTVLSGMQPCITFVRSWVQEAHFYFACYDSLVVNSTFSFVYHIFSRNSIFPLYPTSSFYYCFVIASLTSIFPNIPFQLPLYFTIPFKLRSDDILPQHPTTKTAANVSANPPPGPFVESEKDPSPNLISEPLPSLDAEGVNNARSFARYKTH